MKKDAAENHAGESRVEEPLQEGMMAEERRMQILHILRSEGRAKVNELVRRFNTSAVTIRSDLNELDQRGLVQRSHGGAVIQDTVSRESPVHERIKSQSKEKQRIGAMAATLIREGETIILDSGTTTLEVARHLKNIPQSSGHHQWGEHRIRTPRLA